MSHAKTLHACVICWHDHEDRARAIAEQLVGRVDQLTVVYSTRDEAPLQGPGEWLQVPDAWYYGRKHRECLRVHQCDVLLQIHADTQCDDWPALVARCRDVHGAFPALGVWAPEIDHSGWQTTDTRVAQTTDGSISFVAALDAIVWSFSAPVAQRLNTLDYDLNNLGWGIDLAAVAFAYTHNLQVIKDSTVPVTHLPGTGYETQEAQRQMQAFLRQLTDQEAVACSLLRGYVSQQRIVLSVTGQPAP